MHKRVYFPFLLNYLAQVIEFSLKKIFRLLLRHIGNPLIFPFFSVLNLKVNHNYTYRSSNMDYNKKNPNNTPGQQKPNLNNDRGSDFNRNRPTGGANAGLNKNIPGNKSDKKDDKKW